ncbi:hypothetical protein BGY98DRAFT_1095782 [Russula aff. rugulosa BPL654]|nr:hypothetical protein BGY98DRAFT_1095782 [Russula aff. rugulosa BPL654]
MPSSTGRRAGSLRSLIADFAAGPDTVISHFSLAVAKKEHLDLCYLTVGINLSLPRISGDKGKLGSSAMLDGSRDLRVDSKVPLAGVELEIFQQEQQVMREKAEVARVALARNQQLLEADEGADSSESDSYAADEKDVELALGLDADATRTLGS